MEPSWTFHVLAISRRPDIRHRKTDTDSKSYLEGFGLHGERPWKSSAGCDSATWSLTEERSFHSSRGFHSFRRFHGHKKTRKKTEPRYKALLQACKGAEAAEGQLQLWKELRKEAATQGLSLDAVDAVDEVNALKGSPDSLRMNLFQTQLGRLKTTHYCSSDDLVQPKQLHCLRVEDQGEVTRPGLRAPRWSLVG